MLCALRFLWQIRISRAVLRRVMHRIRPPIHVQVRHARRTYNVRWINSVWHIDGHHKMNRWKIVIHGGIDGYSRCGKVSSGVHYRIGMGSREEEKTLLGVTGKGGEGTC